LKLAAKGLMLVAYIFLSLALEAWSLALEAYSFGPWSTGPEYRNSRFFWSGFSILWIMTLAPASAVFKKIH